MVFDLPPGPGNPRNTEGDTIPLSDGRLLLAWSRFEGPEDHAQADVRGIESADWGLNWSQPRLLVSSDEAKQNVMSVSLLREASSGDVLLFYVRKNSLADLEVRVRRSTDEGETWSAPRPVSTKPGYNVMNNARVVQLQSGRILAPVAFTSDCGASHHQFSFCYLSDDGGTTWRRGTGTAALPRSAVGCQEPGLIELGEGKRLLMYIRTDLGHVYATQSADEGDTWSEPRPIHTLPAPAAPATMAALPDGSIIAAYNHHPDGAQAGWTGRTPLALARSVDRGHTWVRLDDIESSPDFCYGYTSLRIYGRRVVLTYYVWPRTAPTSFAQTTLRVRVLPVERFTGE